MSEAGLDLQNVIIGDPFNPSNPYNIDGEGWLPINSVDSGLGSNIPNHFKNEKKLPNGDSSLWFKMLGIGTRYLLESSGFVMPEGSFSGADSTVLNAIKISNPSRINSLHLVQYQEIGAFSVSRDDATIQSWATFIRQGKKYSFDLKKIDNLYVDINPKDPLKIYPLNSDSFFTVRDITHAPSVRNPFSPNDKLFEIHKFNNNTKSLNVVESFRLPNQEGDVAYRYNNGHVFISQNDNIWVNTPNGKFIDFPGTGGIAEQDSANGTIWLVSTTGNDKFSRIIKTEGGGFALQQLTLVNKENGPILWKYDTFGTFAYGGANDPKPELLKSFQDKDGSGALVFSWVDLEGNRQLGVSGFKKTGDISTWGISYQGIPEEFNIQGINFNSTDQNKITVTTIDNMGTLKEIPIDIKPAVTTNIGTSKTINNSHLPTPSPLRNIAQPLTP